MTKKVEIVEIKTVEVKMTLTPMELESLYNCLKAGIPKYYNFGRDDQPNAVALANRQSTMDVLTALGKHI